MRTPFPLLKGVFSDAEGGGGGGGGGTIFGTNPVGVGHGRNRPPEV